MSADLALLDQLTEKFDAILKAQLAALSHEHEELAKTLINGLYEVRATVAQVCPNEEATRNLANSLFGQYMSAVEVTVPFLASAGQTDDRSDLENLRQECARLQSALDSAKDDLQRQVTRTGEFEIVAAVDDATLVDVFVRELLLIFSDLDTAISEGFTLIERAEDIGSEAHASSRQDGGLHAISNRLAQLSSAAAEVRARADRLEPKDGITIENTNTALSHIESQLDEHASVLDLLEKQLEQWRESQEDWRATCEGAGRMIEAAQLLFPRFEIDCFALGDTTQELVKAKREQGGRLVLSVQKSSTDTQDTLNEKRQDLANIRTRISELRMQLLPLQSYLSRPVFDSLAPDQQTVAMSMVLCFARSGESLSIGVIHRTLQEHTENDTTTSEQLVLDLLTRLSLFCSVGGKDFAMYGLTESGKHWNHSWKKSQRTLYANIKAARALVDEQREAKRQQEQQNRDERKKLRAQKARQRNDPAIIYNGLSDPKREMLAFCYALGDLPNHRDFVAWSKLIAAASITRVLVEGYSKSKLNALLGLLKHNPRLFKYDEDLSGKRVFALTDLGRSVAAQFPPVSAKALEETRNFAGTSSSLWRQRQRDLLRATTDAARDKLTMDKDYFD